MNWKNSMSNFMGTIVQDYIERGRKEELIETLINQLEKKFDAHLDKDFRKKLENASMKSLKKIRDKIFDIENMNEVKEIIE